MTNDHYLTTRELAELLRIRERKVYDLASAGEVPCVRVVGKLLFPKGEILRWMHAAHSGPELGAAETYPATLVGSHDPLLEWALKESQCGLASFCDGSRDGLDRMAKGEALVCGTHLCEEDGWNVATVKQRLTDRPVVLVEFAQRTRGFILPRGKARVFDTIESLHGLRLAKRQATAASQQLFEELLSEAKVDAAPASVTSACARTEDELGMQVFEGYADAAFGLASVARRLQLDFVPHMQERFDLLVWRRAWFDQPFQLLLRFMQSDEFKQRAETLGGYDLSHFGTVRYNSSSG